MQNKEHLTLLRNGVLTGESSEAALAITVFHTQRPKMFTLKGCR